MTTATEQDGASGTQAVERLLKVLEVVGANPDGAEVSTIAAALGLSTSTTYRLAGVLQRQGYLVKRNQEPRYLLGRAVTMLGMAANRQLLATPAVRAVLEATRDEIHAPVYLTAFHVDEIVVAHIADSADYPRIGQLHVGFADAAHVTAFGKLMLAQKSSKQLDSYLDEHPPMAITRHSPTGAVALREQLEQVRENRVAIEVEEYMSSLACIAAPVRSPRGHTIGAVSVSVSANDFGSRADVLERAVRRTAWTVSSQLE